MTLRSSRESNLAQLREALAQRNSEFFLNLGERRALSLQIQELKDDLGQYSHYDPAREKEVFELLKKEINELSLKELLAFSLIMEDQAMAMAPGSYPTWSQFTHLNNPKREIFEMINPLLLKVSRPELYSKLTFTPEFQFLQDF